MNSNDFPVVYFNKPGQPLIVQYDESCIMEYSFDSDSVGSVLMALLGLNPFSGRVDSGRRIYDAVDLSHGHDKARLIKTLESLPSGYKPKENTQESSFYHSLRYIWATRVVSVEIELPASYEANEDVVENAIFDAMAAAYPDLNDEIGINYGGDDIRIEVKTRDKWNEPDPKLAKEAEGVVRQAISEVV
ncbi:MAG: hypothetical protein CMH98_03740 [Oceanospirillaceae bacterium]|nr:hypothetical protein [Oceanospirillaceae bacterium]